MKYLVDLGFDEELINRVIAELPNEAVNQLQENEDVVTNNINYLKNLGVSNYQDAFIKFYNMFLMDEESFSEIFSKYDKEDLIAKLEKNVAIMEYL